MHKSIILFLGLLTFLLPVVPSSMSNSNVMAFEDYGYGYEADQYNQRYGMDMMANGYAEDDYKQQSTTYYNDNNYKSKNSDFIKKIKCINHNINVNGDNTGDINLGNDDQGSAAGERYLSAGSFGSGYGNEGYDKKVFDCVTNNNDNTNEQGGQGQVGPQGPQGERGFNGTAGITQLTVGTNIYLVQNSAAPPPPTTGVEVSALCDTGDFVLNGGYDVGTFGSGSARIDKPITSEGDPGSGWRVAIINTVPGQAATVYAFCFDNPPLRP